MFRFVTFCLQYGVIVVEFFISFLPEPKSEYQRHKEANLDVGWEMFRREGGREGGRGGRGGRGVGRR